MTRRLAYIAVCVVLAMTLVSLTAEPWLFWITERWYLVATVALGFVLIGVGYWNGHRHKRPGDAK